MASNINPTLTTFVSFYNVWISKQESLLQEHETLISPNGDGFFYNRTQQCSAKTKEIISYYQQFYNEKSKAAANEDVFLVLSSPWLSSFERSLMWVAGFRPSMIFPIVENTLLNELSLEQKQRFEDIKTEIKRREDETTQAMARIQETVAEQPVYKLMRNLGRLVDGERTDAVLAMEALKAAMMEVLGGADELRAAAVAEVVEILDPVQSVKFFAAVLRLNIQARKWGLEKDSQRGR